MIPFALSSSITIDQSESAEEVCDELKELNDRQETALSEKI